MQRVQLDVTPPRGPADFPEKPCGSQCANRLSTASSGGFSAAWAHYLHITSHRIVTNFDAAPRSTAYMRKLENGATKGGEDNLVTNPILEHSAHGYASYLFLNEHDVRSLLEFRMVV